LSFNVEILDARAVAAPLQRLVTDDVLQGLGHITERPWDSRRHVEQLHATVREVAHGQPLPVRTEGDGMNRRRFEIDETATQKFNSVWHGGGQKPEVRLISGH